MMKEKSSRPLVSTEPSPPWGIEVVRHRVMRFFIEPWREPVCSAAMRLLSCIMFATVLMMGGPSLTAPSSVTIGGPFTLTASDGTTVTDQTYRGRWLLVFFGYSSCPDVCPTALFTIATALQKLGPDAAKLQPIFITVDPQRDTPQVLEEYIRSFDQRIVGLTGTSDQIAAAAREYGAYYVRHHTGSAGEDYAIAHSSYLYLMDPRGQFVRGVDAGTSADHLAEMLRELMAQ
jgi:protein SCO1